MVSGKAVAGKISRRLVGSFEVDQGLSQLIGGTGSQTLNGLTTSAGTANATIQINGATSAVNNVTPAAAEAVEAGGEDAFITSRTFDLYWVDKTALMYKDGYVKVRLFYGVLLRGWGGGCGGRWKK